MVKLLFKKGVKFDLPEGTQNSPFQAAIEAESEEMLDLFLNNGVQVNKDHVKFAQKIKKSNEIMEKLIRKMENQKSTKIVSVDEPDPKRLKLEDCVLCHSPRKDVFVLNPCGHAKTCEICCLKIMHLPEINTSCPVCQKNVEFYVKAFY